jgi:hypothetical protein
MPVFGGQKPLTVPWSEPYRGPPSGKSRSPPRKPRVEYHAPQHRRAPGPIAALSGVQHGIFQNVKTFKPGNLQKKRRDKVETAQDLPGYKPPPPKPKTLPNRTVGYRKSFGSTAGQRVKDSTNREANLIKGKWSRQVIKEAAEIDKSNEEREKFMAQRVREAHMAHLQTYKTVGLKKGKLLNQRGAKYARDRADHENSGVVMGMKFDRVTGDPIADGRVIAPAWKFR